MSIIRGQATKWRVKAFNAAGSVTGDAAQITAKISKDYGPRIDLADVNPTEAEDGYYYFDLTASETDANRLELFPDSSTSGVEVLGDPPSQWTTTTTSGSGGSGGGAAAGSVAEAMGEPKRASSDGVMVEQHSLADMIAAEKHVAKQTAASNKYGGMRFQKLVPPGA